MARKLSPVSDPVVLHIWSSLHNYAYNDALFAAERLYAETKNNESLYMLATSLYRVGRPKQVSKLLVSCKHLTPKSRCYYDVGSLADAESTLLSSNYSSASFDELSDIYEEQSCYVFLLLGDICKRQGRISEAVSFYKKCLELNPFMWSAFENLCNIGENVAPSSVFRISSKLAILAPTYSVLLDNTVYSENSINDKKDCIDVSIQENLNPEDTSSQEILSTTGCENAHLDYSMQSDVNSQLGSQRIYVSYCSRKFKNELCEGIKQFDNFLTPDDLAPPTIPKAPKPKISRTSSSDNNSCGNSTSSAKFGILTVFPQSPMFACIPLFSKRNQNNSPESVLTANRSCVNYCSSVLHANISKGEFENIDVTEGSQINTCNTNSSIVCNKKEIIDDEATPSVNVSQNNIVDIISSNINGVDCSPNLTNAIRYLACTSSLNLGSLSLELATNSPTGSFVNSPDVRREPPLLRSAVQRNLPYSPRNSNVRESPLVLRSNVQLFNSGSQHPDISTSSTPRPLSNQQISVDINPSGPRTRSQVAAAAAVARASGIQRRSNRLLRSRGNSRKSDSKPLSQDCQKNLTYQNTTDTENLLSNINLDQSSRHDCSNPSNRSNTQHNKASVEMLNSSTRDPRLHSIEQYLELLVHLGKAYQLLVNHHWRSANRLLSKLSLSQIPTCRILSWAARAHMDNADYQTAHTLFSEAHRREPWQVCGMDYYSTVLWQLQADQELSHLAHDLLELDRNAPEPWCAAGNCFSLQGEHETAIKFFRKALQVCPTNAYAWTLLGHEQSTLEEFDKALTAFQFALRLDPRHYNALFGISNVYYKQEKFDLAETYLSRAVNLFPNSHLLLTNLAALRSRLGRIDNGPGSAMDLANRACELQPNNPLARYHRASILFHLGQYSAVLSELKKLLILTPREAMVYLMIGHTYKKLGNTPQAMIHYSWAMELDPKGANILLRDIMTNPPVSNRGPNHINTAEAGHGTATPGRSQLNSFPNTLRINFDDDGDIAGVNEETISNLISTTTPNANRQGATNSGVRRLVDFSLLYDDGGYREEPVLSDADDEQYDTMDISGTADERNGQVIPDD